MSVISLLKKLLILLTDRSKWQTPGAAENVLREIHSNTEDRITKFVLDSFFGSPDLFEKLQNLCTQLIGNELNQLVRECEKMHEEYKDPFTGKMIRDPVSLVENEHIFERSTLVEHLKHNNTCPVEKRELRSKEIRNCLYVKKILKRHIEEVAVNGREFLEFSLQFLKKFYLSILVVNHYPIKLLKFPPEKPENVQMLGQSTQLSKILRKYLPTNIDFLYLLEQCYVLQCDYPKLLEVRNELALLEIDKLKSNEIIKERIFRAGLINPNTDLKEVERLSIRMLENNELLKDDASVLESLFELCGFYERTKQDDKVRLLMQKYVQIYPNNLQIRALLAPYQQDDEASRSFYLMAKHHFDRNRSDEKALKMLEMSIEKDDTNELAYSLLLEVYLNRNDTENAQMTLRKLLTMNADDTHRRMELLKKSLQLNPTDFHTLEELCEMYYASGDVLEIIELTKEETSESRMSGLRMKYVVRSFERVTGFTTIIQTLQNKTESLELICAENHKKISEMSKEIIKLRKSGGGGGGGNPVDTMALIQSFMREQRKLNDRIDSLEKTKTEKNSTPRSEPSTEQYERKRKKAAAEEYQRKRKKQQEKQRKKELEEEMERRQRYMVDEEKRKREKENEMLRKQQEELVKRREREFREKQRKEKLKRQEEEDERRREKYNAEQVKENVIPSFVKDRVSREMYTRNNGGGDAPGPPKAKTKETAHAEVFGYQMVENASQEKKRAYEPLVPEKEIMDEKMEVDDDEFLQVDDKEIGLSNSPLLATGNESEDYKLLDDLIGMEDEDSDDDVGKDKQRERENDDFLSEPAIPDAKLKPVVEKKKKKISPLKEDMDFEKLLAPIDDDKPFLDEDIGGGDPYFLDEEVSFTQDPPKTILRTTGYDSYGPSAAKEKKKRVSIVEEEKKTRRKKKVPARVTRRKKDLGPAFKKKFTFRNPSRYGVSGYLFYREFKAFSHTWNLKVCVERDSTVSVSVLLKDDFYKAHGAMTVSFGGMSKTIYNKDWDGGRTDFVGCRKAFKSNDADQWELDLTLSIDEMTMMEEHERRRQGSEDFKPFHYDGEDDLEEIEFY